MQEAKLARRALNIHDLRALAHRRLPKVVFDYVDGGAEDGVGRQGNRDALDRLAFVPRVMRGVGQVEMATELFGTPTTLPIGISATGGASMIWYDGDVALARAAKAKGVPFMISSSATTPMERVADVGGRLWCQYAPSRNPALAPEIIGEAQALGYEALVITVDTAASPNREYNIRNGLTWPLQIKPRTALDAGRKPRWLGGVFLRYMMEGGLPRLGREVSDYMGADIFTWDDLAEMRKMWRGPLLVKGILSPRDARRAVELGCQGVIVSNHGGRSLDQSVSSIEALRPVVDAVDGRGEVFFDSGVRRGSDVVKALALGADFVFVGRATLYGLATAGEAGVGRALDILAKETRQVMALCGCRSVEEITPDLIADAQRACPGGAFQPPP